MENDVLSPAASMRDRVAMYNANALHFGVLTRGTTEYLPLVIVAPRRGPNWSEDEESSG